MNVAWKVPKPGDIGMIYNQSVADVAQVTLTDKGTGALQMTIDRVRGAIDAGHRVPLSVTPNSVPPSAVMHVLVLTVHAITSQPGFLTEGQKPTEFAKKVQQAEDWIEAVEKGKVVETPTDPDPSFVGLQVNSTCGFVDMTTD